MTYRIGAEKYYDLFGAKNDAQFYLPLAQKHGCKALELGVGTARLAIQLARAGVDVWGIDNSSYMLRAAEANLAKETAEVKGRVHLRLGDAKDFELGERFGLIYFPSFSFDHLLTQEDQTFSLRSIRRHLTSSGVLAFDLAHIPRIESTSGWFVQRKTLDEHKTVLRSGFHKIIPQRSLMSSDLWYELYEDGLMIERYHEGGEVYIHTPEGIKKLLEENGFKITDWYGGHDKMPFNSDSEMMVIVAGLA